jgi:hypothetical protein
MPKKENKKKFILMMYYDMEGYTIDFDNTKGIEAWIKLFRHEDQPKVREFLSKAKVGETLAFYDKNCIVRIRDDAAFA